MLYPGAPKPRSNCLLVLFALAGSYLLAFPAQAAEVEFEVVASNGEEDETAPGSTFQVLEGPAAIDGAGNLYFESRNGVLTDPASTTTNIWRVNPDSVRTRLVSSAQAAPDVISGNDPGTLQFLEFTDSSSPSVDAAVTEDGRVFFASSRLPSSGNELFVASSDGSIENIARSPNTQPGNNETVNDGLVYADGRGNSIQGFATDDGFRVLRANSSGAVAYQGQVVLSQIVASADPGLSTRGLFTGTSRANTRAVAFVGTAAAGTTSTWSNLSLLGLSGDGTVYFSGDLADGSEGIWQDRFGVVTLIAKTGDAAPSFGDGRTLAGVGGGFDAREVSVNSNGEIAFLGVVTDGINTDADELVLWRGAPGNLTAVSLGNDSGANDVLLGSQSGTVTARFTLNNNRFESLLLADNGDVIFSGEYRDVAGNSVPINAALRLAAGSSQVSALQTSGNAFSISAINDTGQAIFQSGTSFRTLYAYDPVAGVSEVFTPNQVTDFGTVTNFEVMTTSNGGASGRSTSFNDAAQIAVAVFTTGGTSGIDHLVRANVTFTEIVDNAFRFSGTCGSSDWHAGCTDTNWVDSDNLPQDRSPGDLGDENVIIESANVVLSDRAATLASLSVDSLSSLTVQQDLTVTGSANIANLILQAKFTAQGATNLVDPDIGGDIETPLVAPFRINGTNGTWSAGRITGPSATVIEGDALLTVVDEVALGNRLEINGGLEILDGGDLELSINASVLNEGTLTLQGGSSVTNFDTDISSTFNNNGQINKRGSGEATITSDFRQAADGGVVVNEGSLSIRQGEMHLAGVLQTDDDTSLLIEATEDGAHRINTTRFTGAGVTRIRNGAFEAADDASLILADGTLVLDNVASIRANGGQLRVLDAGSTGVSRFEKTGDGVTTLQGFDVEINNSFFSVKGGDLLIDGSAILDESEVTIASGALFSLGESGTTTIRGQGGLSNEDGIFISRNQVDIEEGATFLLSGGINQIFEDVAVAGELDLRNARLELQDNTFLDAGDTAELRFIGSNEVFAEGSLQDEIDPRIFSSGVLRKLGDGATRIHSGVESTGVLLVEAGELEFSLGAVLTNQVTIAKDAEFRVGGLGGTQLDDLTVSGEGLWTISEAEHFISSPTVIALGTTDVQALDRSGLVLDNVRSFGRETRNLRIGREDPTVVSRLLKIGFEQTFIGADVVLNSVIESRNALLKFSDVELFNTSIITRDGGLVGADEVLAEGNVSAAGSGKVLWEEGFLLEDTSLTLFSDFDAAKLTGATERDIGLELLGNVQPSSSRLLGRDVRIGTGAQVQINQGLFEIDVAITDEVDVIEDTCGTVCLASAPSKNPEVLRDDEVLSPSEVVEGQVGKIRFGDFFNSVTLRNTQLTVGEGGTAQFANDATFAGGSVLINELGGVVELEDGVSLVGDGGFGRFINRGRVRTLGNVDIRLPEFEISSESEFIARPGELADFADVSIRSTYILRDPLGGGGQVVSGAWDIEDVVLRVFGDNDQLLVSEESPLVDFQSEIRLAGSAEFAGLSRDLRSAIIDGKLVLDSIAERDGTAIAIQGDVPVVFGSGALQLIDTDLHVDTLSIRENGVFQSNASVSGEVINAGKIDIGASPGRLTINGNLAVEAGGSLLFELGGDQAGISYDQLVVEGTATFDASSILDIRLLEVAGELFLPQNGTQFELLVATEVVSSASIAELIQFSNAPNGFRFTLDQELANDGFRLLLNTFLGSDLASLGLVGQDQTIAEALDAISLEGKEPALVDLALLIDALPTQDAQGAVASLSNNFTTGLYDVGRVSELNRRFGLARLVQAGRRDVRSGSGSNSKPQGFGYNQLNNRRDWVQLASQLADGTPTRRFSDSVTAMLDVRYNNSSFDATRRGGDDVDLDGATLSAGVAVQQETLHWGVLAQFGDYRADPDGGGSLDIEDWSVTGYAGLTLGDDQHHLTLSYGYGQYDARYNRQLAIPGSPQRVEGRTDAEYISAALRYDWQLPRLNGGPMAELSHFRAVVDDLAESGAVGGLAIRGDSYGHTAASVGWLLDIVGGSQQAGWQMDLGVYYQHLINQDYNHLEASFLGAPANGFAIAQPTRENGVIQAELDARWHAKDNLVWFVNLGYAHARDMRHGSVGAGVNYRF